MHLSYLIPCVPLALTVFTVLVASRQLKRRDFSSAANYYLLSATLSLIQLGVFIWVYGGTWLSWVNLAVAGSYFVLFCICHARSAQ